MWSQAALRGLVLALLAPAAACLRPPPSLRAAAPAASEAPGRSQSTPAALPPALLSNGTASPRSPRQLAAVASGGRTVGGLLLPDEAAPIRTHVAVPEGIFAFPQTLEGLDLRRLLMGVAIHKHTLMWIIIVETLILLITVIAPMLVWMGTRLLGNTIEAGIETFDKDVLGVDVEIGRLTPNLLYGILDVEDLEVKNPAGKGYDSEYLLRAKRIHIDIDMLRLFCSFFKHVKIEKVVFQNVDIIYEKHWNSSNVQDVLAYLKKEQAQEAKKDDTKALETKDSFTSSEQPRSRTPPRTPPNTPMDAPEPAGFSAGSPKAAAEAPSVSRSVSKASLPPAPEDNGGVDVTLHEVLIEDVGARAQAKMLGGRGFRVAISDISYKDFAQEVGTAGLSHVVIILLKTVLKTVLANIIGKKMGDQCM